ncbi:APC family permease [Rhodococcus daqingensis]|uniref:APC family permease n=1 Tax=Rhodococcus daqingensis TaxID=2479363 RepID=A0ABW2RUF5_9NOCA
MAESTGLLSTRQLVALVVSSGIPAVGMASFPMLLFGTAGWGSWAAALLTTVVGFSLGRVIMVFARRSVASGSLSSYVAEVSGERSRAVVAGALLLGYLGQMVAIQVLAATYVTSFFTSTGFGFAGTPESLIVIFLLTGLVPAAIAWRGLDASVRWAVTLTVISVPVVLTISVASAWHTGLQLGQQLSMEGSTWGGILVGFGAAASWLAGFESGVTLAEETAEPTKSMPVAVLAVPVVTIGYLLVTMMQIPGLMLVGDQIRSGVSAPAALAELAGLGRGVGQACDLLLTVGVFAALIGFTNYLSRLVVGYAAEGMLPSLLSRHNRRHGTPTSAIAVATGISTVALIIVVAVSDEWGLTVYTMVSTSIVYLWAVPYACISVGVLVLLARERAMRVPIIVCALIGGTGMLWPWVNSLVDPPPSPINHVSYGAVIAVVVVGTAFYLQRARRGRDVADPVDTAGTDPAGEVDTVH